MDKYHVINYTIFSILKYRFGIEKARDLVGMDPAFVIACSQEAVQSDKKYLTFNSDSNFLFDPKGDREVAMKITCNACIQKLKEYGL